MKPLDLGSLEPGWRRDVRNRASRAQTGIQRAVRTRPSEQRVDVSSVNLGTVPRGT